VHLHSLLQILNSCCGICWSTSDNSSFVDPRSTLLHSQQHELNTPSLNDVSKCLSNVILPNATRGEAAVERHDASTDSVQRDRTESVSDASQYVAGGCAVRYPSLSDTPLASTVSSPSLDDDSGNHTSISPSPQGSTIFESMNGSMSSRLPSLTPSPRSFDAGPSIQTVVPQVPLSTGRFTCPSCPRTFAGQIKREFVPASSNSYSVTQLTILNSRHAQTYRHIHVCPVSGCPWNFNLAKDLRRHLAQHNPQAPRYQCPVSNCRTRRHRLGNTFSRPDLLTRHMERFHG
jgi:hypothetical protein